MNKEILEEKIAKLLKVSDQEKNLAFRIFKEKLSETLQIGEAIRINDLGVFQLKEQLDHRSATKEGEKSKSLTIVFSPDSEDSSPNSLFVNLEIDNTKNDETEFNDNVFQLGIGKPLVIDSDQKFESGEKIESVAEKVQNEVSNLFVKSEILKDFDLWEDYLERKETTNILEDAEDNDLSIDSILDENEAEILNDDIDQIDDEFIPQTDDENFDELEEKNSLIDDDFKDQADGIDIEEINIPDSIDESLQNVVEGEGQLDEIDLEYGDEEDDEPDLNKEVIEKKSIIEKIDEELAADELNDKGSIDEQIYEDEINASGDDAKFLEPENETDDEIDYQNEGDAIESEDDISVDELSNEEIQVEELSSLEEKRPAKRSKSLIWLLITAFIVIGAIGIYYLFFNSTSINNQEQTELALDEESVAANDDESAGEINQEVEIPDEEIIESPKEARSENFTEESESKISNQNAVEDEKEVAKNIYFDGFVYNAQISSWKQEKIAQTEVNKLVKGGFPAYKVKVYIPKFDGYWHRVRIGPFTTKQEAEEVLKKANK